MPKYRVETNERRWVHFTYELEALDVKDAITRIEELGIEPTSSTSGDGDFDSDDVQFLAVVEIKDESEPPSQQPPTPLQELRRIAAELPLGETQRLMSVIQKFLWWDKANDTWDRDLPPSLDTLDFIADVLDRAGLRPVELLDRNT
jgi:hypothetical protein